MEEIDKTPEEITEEINATYEDLSDKVQLLEAEVVNSLDGTKAFIQTTLKDVKSLWPFRYPIAIFGCVVAGFAARQLLSSPTKHQPLSGADALGASAASPEQFSLIEEIKSQVKNETLLLKNFASELALDKIEESLEGRLPRALSSSVERVFSNVRRKLTQDRVTRNL